MEYVITKSAQFSENLPFEPVINYEVKADGEKISNIVKLELIMDSESKAPKLVIHSKKVVDGEVIDYYQEMRCADITLRAVTK